MSRVFYVIDPAYTPGGFNILASSDDILDVIPMAEQAGTSVREDVDGDWVAEWVHVERPEGWAPSPLWQRLVVDDGDLD